MDRRAILLDGITKSQTGIEIGPWFNPLVPKREGYRSLSLDVFDRARLVERALVDPNVPREMIEQIEPVDLLGTVTQMGEMIEREGLVGKLDYVISSHNFEHIPDPIRFLQACELGLKPGGRLVMAVPDRRGCFDFFRPHSITADFIDAYFHGRARPTAHQIFTQNSLHSRQHANGEQRTSFLITDDPSLVRPFEGLAEAFASWKGMIEAPGDDYVDVHCWSFTPSSFELIINDLAFLRLTRMAVRSVVPSGVDEFYTRLVFIPDGLAPIRDEFYAQRGTTLHRIHQEASVSAGRGAGVDMGELRASIAELRNQMASLQRLHEEASADAARRAEANMTEVRAWVTDLQNQVVAMRTSTSWRLTAPMRAASRWLRRST